LITDTALSIPVEVAIRRGDSQRKRFIRLAAKETVGKVKANHAYKERKKHRQEYSHLTLLWITLCA